MDQIAHVINKRLEKIPLTRDEKDFLVCAVEYGKFRQTSIHMEAGGYFGIVQSREEVTNGEWLFFWCYPRDRVQPDLRGYHNVHYTLKPDGALTLTRDE